MNYKVTHYPTRQRFEIELENMTAYAKYRLTDYTNTHTTLYNGN